ncbi:MAG: protease complex subunit PrcB family protein [Elusimicrobia bacterium]|nr:protease complex subunit PrcB family protein [Elusimicrobiota bacterium]
MISRPAVFLCCALAVNAAAADKKKEKTTMEWTGSFCPVDSPEHLVIKDEAGWKALWGRIGKPAPEADFQKHFAVAVFLGTMPTGGYTVTWTSQTSNGKDYLLWVRYKVKKPDGMAIQALTQPYAVRLFYKFKPGEGFNEIKVEAVHD